IYPIAMTTVVLLILTYFVPSPKLSLQLPVFLVTILSIITVIHRNGWLTMDWLEVLPLFRFSFEWIPFLIVGYIVGYLMSMNKTKIEYSYEKSPETFKFWSFFINIDIHLLIEVSDLLILFPLLLIQIQQIYVLLILPLGF